MRRHLAKITLICMAGILSCSSAFGQIRQYKVPTGTLPIKKFDTATPNSISNRRNGPQASNPQDSLGEQQPKGIEYHEEIPDSILRSSVFMFSLQPLDVKIMELTHPTLSPTGVQFNDRLERMDGNYYLSAGELGHPHYGVFLSAPQSLTLRYKADIQPCYTLTPNSVAYFQTQRPFTVLSYQSSLDKDYQVHASHTQNIMPRWNIALNYDLVNPEGVYSNSAALDHLLDINTNYYSRDARYVATAGIIWQKYTFGENGGLLDDDIFIHRRISNEGGIPVRESARGSVNNNLTLFTRHSFNTVRQFDRYHERHMTIFDTIADSLTTRIVPRDTLLGIDTIPQLTPSALNTGVFAFDAQYERQRQRYVDSTAYHLLSTRIYWTNDAHLDQRWKSPAKVWIGIRPQIARLERGDTNYRTASVQRIEVYPFVRSVLNIGKRFEIDLNAESATRTSEFRFAGEAALSTLPSDSIRNQRLSMLLLAQSQFPDMVFSSILDHADTPVRPDLLPIATQRIELRYVADSLLHLSAAASRISRNVWFDTSLTPIQSDDEALLLQGKMLLTLQFWNWLHFDCQQLVQYSSDQQQIRVPLFASKNSIYADIHLFHHALRAQIGFDIRYHTAFYADTYNPTLGVFCRQDDVTVGNYLWGDIFINLQVKRASIYAKAGHLNSLLEKEAHYFTLPHYPGKGFGLFFGMTWKFFD